MSPKKPRRQHVLEVVAREQVTPHVVRVRFGGADVRAMAAERPDATDSYLKLLFPDPALGLVPPYDLDELPREHQPVRRTYTIRTWHADGTISVDFVTHGDQGIAAPWAMRAQPGDLVAANGPGSGYRPSGTASWYLLVGDDSALPAISAALEALPTDARGQVVVEVDAAADELLPQTPAGVAVQWLHRDGATPGEGSLLPDALRALDWPTDGVEVFAHGERESMKSLRDILFREQALPRESVSLSGYWAFGRTEDRFQAEKREPIGQIG
ncbi:siderophore-interacting protein [Allobranchiibius huperziae]|uniref:NADPH-dependent ferric siderophore reductase n=1 Tax=Allobranchiibius huperziae TaxID=1874116 RepID=A0A853D9P9_9MICO|nr:siderophore-interacting protein [Allobranchiibius huperziae]NYJ73317.1 NADPH-dependent ferric siderophore reductase [Allobranchiibius huperziae]